MSEVLDRLWLFFFWYLSTPVVEYLGGHPCKIPCKIRIVSSFVLK